MSTTPFWTPGRHRDRRPWLKARSAMTAAARTWFDSRGYTEVETAALQVSPGNETHLHGLPVAVTGSDGTRVQRYLHTSPEFAMKKLLAAGETAIFALARVWRDRSRSVLHATEFTMLEWYRVGQAFAATMDDTVALACATAEAAQTDALTFRGRMADAGAAPERISVAEAFAAHADIDLNAIGEDRDAFAAAARDRGIRTADDDDWSDVFSRVLSEKVEPRLGDGRFTLLYGYPAPEAALARLSPENPSIAERFELYACGVELANGFAELTDAAAQRARFVAAMDRHEAIHDERFPLDEDFLAALAVMPEACGVALGFDRLAMLATGAPSVHHVMWTPEPGTLDEAW